MNADRHVPPRESGVSEDLILRDSTPITCLRSILTHEVLNDLLNQMNEYTAYSCRQLSDALYLLHDSQWLQMNSDYHCASKTYTATPLYNQMFPRDKFQALYHSMFHVSEVNAQGKAKIELFFNRLMIKCQTVLSIPMFGSGQNNDSAHKTFNAVKPKKYVKTFSLCDNNIAYQLCLGPSHIFLIRLILQSYDSP